MNDLHARALKALGIKKLERMCEDEERALLIGLLMQELDRLTKGDFVVRGSWFYGKCEVSIREGIKIGSYIRLSGEGFLEALVLAAEAAKEATNV